ncbi:MULTISPECIES: ABC transporter ATP-binding protein [unclassified Rhizobium]|uniref:ABC transporter ATP-binding protein n=1 Tax=unclassified Rhizobium TaxID=2613769 RepID=UPI002478997E|nr:MULTISPECIES: ABC transporter ATP-binding protein [unclassified Rhizobium]MDH7803893.1 peptide/nickel transport system ATP-binding protein [Rhizobium sp. AN70]
MNDILLSVRNLRVEFNTRRGTLTALRDVSFDIRRGEVLGVVGESGAGKSMTGSAIMHLIPRPGRISSGEIHLGDRRIDNLGQAEIEAIRGRHIGMVFQDPLTSLNPLMKVGEHLMETMRVHLGLSRRAARDRAVELLEEVGIPDPAVRMDSYPHEFSGGQRQRVVIALALCAGPELVIADEPTTALDVSVQAQIIRLIRKLCETHGTAFMLITHDMGMIAETADRVAVMYAGRVAEIGKVADVVKSPLHPYAQGLMGAIPSLESDEPRLRQIPGSMPSLSATPKGCAFNPRCERVMDICRVDQPELAGRWGHMAACHLYPREYVA